MPRHVIAQPLPMDLRNWSFRGRNCEGWDFEGRDIRGCDFGSANLHKANFSQCTAGRTLKQIIYDFFVVFFTMSSVIVAAISIGDKSFYIVNIILTIQGLSSLEPNKVRNFLGITKWNLHIILAACTGIYLGASSYPISSSINDLQKGNILGAFFWGLSSFIFIGSAILNLNLIKQELKQRFGTSFRASFLANANFSGSILHNCNFDGSRLQFINWYKATGNFSSIDFSTVKMKLLTQKSGVDQMLLSEDLSNQDLSDGRFIKSKFLQVDFTNSNLRNSDFTLSDLSNAKMSGADLRNATLTGICIQNWSINSKTKFDGIICDYIYLTPDCNPQNRRPLSGSFEPGDFAKLVDKFANSLDFILRRGTDPILFRQSLNQFQQDNPEAKIKMMVDLDTDRVLVQTTLPEGMDKVKPYEAFLENQAKLLQSAQQDIRYLEGRLEEKEKSESMIERLFHSSQRPNLDARHSVFTGDLMSDKRTQIQAGGDSISVGDNNQGVVGKNQQGVAGRDISGTLTLSLSALSATDNPKSKALVELITQVRDAIQAPDSELDDRYKTRALEYLDNLTNLAKDKPENLLKTAKDNLDDLADIADKGSKIATFAEKYLPTFTATISGLRLWFGI
jgi:uncharacterized protein YjbI with pentapeptide repeats